MGYKARVILYVIDALVKIQQEDFVILALSKGTAATNRGLVHSEGSENQLSVEVVDLEKNWEEISQDTGQRGGKPLPTLRQALRLQ